MDGRGCRSAVWSGPPLLTASGRARRPARIGPGAAIVVIRTKAVTPTAIAPMTEKTICQVSDGMVCFTMPWVA